MDAASAANLASLSLRSRFQLPAQLLGAPASARVLLADSYLLPGNTVPMAMENHLLMAAQQQQVIGVLPPWLWDSLVYFWFLFLLALCMRLELIFHACVWMLVHRELGCI